MMETTSVSNQFGVQDDRDQPHLANHIRVRLFQPLKKIDFEVKESRDFFFRDF